jgi:hypothetical protein
MGVALAAEERKPPRQEQPAQPDATPLDADAVAAQEAVLRTRPQLPPVRRGYDEK